MNPLAFFIVLEQRTECVLKIRLFYFDQKKKGERTMAKKDFNNFSGLVRLTKDARLIAATNQEGTNAQLFFTGACNEGYQTKDGTDAVSFIEFRMNGKRATALAQYLTKGVSVIISRSRLRAWSQKNPDGTFTNRYVVDVDEIEFVGGHPHGQAQAAEGSSGTTRVLEVTSDDLPF